MLRDVLRGADVTKTAITDERIFQTRYFSRKVELPLKLMLPGSESNTNACARMPKIFPENGPGQVSFLLDCEYIPEVDMMLDNCGSWTSRAGHHVTAKRFPIDEEGKGCAASTATFTLLKKYCTHDRAIPPGSLQKCLWVVKRGERAVGRALLSYLIMEGCTVPETPKRVMNYQRSRPSTTNAIKRMRQNARLPLLPENMLEWIGGLSGTVDNQSLTSNASQSNEIANNGVLSWLEKAVKLECQNRDDSLLTTFMTDTDQQQINNNTSVDHENTVGTTSMFGNVIGVGYTDTVSATCNIAPGPSKLLELSSIAAPMNEYVDGIYRVTNKTTEGTNSELLECGTTSDPAAIFQAMLERALEKHTSGILRISGGMVTDGHALATLIILDGKQRYGKDVLDVVARSVDRIFGLIIINVDSACFAPLPSKGIRIFLVDGKPIPVEESLPITHMTVSVWLMDGVSGEAREMEELMDNYRQAKCALGSAMLNCEESLRQLMKPFVRDTRTVLFFGSDDIAEHWNCAATFHAMKFFKIIYESPPEET